MQHNEIQMFGCTGDLPEIDPAMMTRFKVIPANSAPAVTGEREDMPPLITPTDAEGK
jgi:hypothetical protein